MLLPNADLAEVAIRKLTEYCLKPDHPEGKHKARLFEAALAMTADDAQFLRRALLDAARRYDAKMGLLDDYGQRYTVDFELDFRGRRATIRSRMDCRAWFKVCASYNMLSALRGNRDE